MKNKTLFGRVIFVMILAVACLLMTVGLAILAGSLNAELFDFKNMNFSNIIPVLLIGGFISCVIVGICVLFIARDAFFKAKNYLEDKGETKK